MKAVLLPRMVLASTAWQLVCDTHALGLLVAKSFRARADERLWVGGLLLVLLRAAGPDSSI